MAFFTGGDGNDVLIGTGEADVLDGRAGNDTLKGGKGNDVYFVDSAKDIVTEGANAGIDTVIANIASYTLAANFENLLLDPNGVNATGNALANNITGSGAANLLSGGVGNDTINGSSGLDTLDGGAGNDTFVDLFGGDVLKGGAGNDIYRVLTDQSVFVEAANGGIDTIEAIDISFSLNALPTIENLTLDGNGDTNGFGNDLSNKLTGNADKNSLTGAGGNDTLDGGADADIMIGGSGNDVYVVDDAGDQVIEGVGGGTKDKILSAITFTLSDDIEELTLTGDANISGTGNELANVITGNVNNNKLDGGEGNDTLSGGDGDDFLKGGAGNDVLIGGKGRDFYFIDSAGDKLIEAAGPDRDFVNSSLKSYTLGANLENLQLLDGAINGIGNALANEFVGNDLDNKLEGLAGNDDIRGGGGNDLLIGGAGNDNMSGQAGIDILDGGAGHDELIDQDGGDILKGGSGNDRYIVRTTNSAIVESVSAGIDEVVAIDISFSIGKLGAIENLRLIGAAVTGTGNDLSNKITGNAIANALSGLAGNDTLDGGGGLDHLEGGIGNDTYFVDDLGDVVVEVGKAGKDTVFASTTYALKLGEEIESLTLTGDGDNTAIGNEIANVLTGNAGANFLLGGGGKDTMAGGKGDDFYRVEEIGDKVVEAAKSGTDTVESSLASYTLSANVENLHLIGGALNGTGNTLANDIDGNALTNALNGGAGNDTLFGADGRDTLLGGAGNDTLEGGLGVDILTGGTGKDLYLYRIDNAGELGALGEDAINGFVRGADKIDISDLLDDFGIDPSNAIGGGFLELLNNNGNTIVRFDSTGGADSFVTLAVVNNVVVTEADFVL